MISDERLKEIEERCEAATPGPWLIAEPLKPRIFTRGSGRLANFYDSDQEVSRDWDNAEFCACARADLPDLVAAYRELQTEYTELRKVLSLERRERRLAEERAGRVRL